MVSRSYLPTPGKGKLLVVACVLVLALAGVATAISVVLKDSRPLLFTGIFLAMMQAVFYAWGKLRAAWSQDPPRKQADTSEMGKTSE